MKKLLSIVLIFAAILSLTSCSLLSPVKTKPASAYEIDQIPTYVPQKKKHAVNILVLLPDEVTAYNTTSMAYTLRPYEISYYSQSRWSETPAQMLLPLLVQTLQKTNYFQAVLTPPFGGKYDYTLVTQILRLEQDFTHTPAALVFVVRAQLNQISSDRMIATKEIRVVQPMMRNDAYSGVVAANQAVEKILKQMAEFCMSHAK